MVACKFRSLAKRLEKRSDRPLLQTADPQQTLKALIKKRYPIYNDADFIVDAKMMGSTLQFQKWLNVWAIIVTRNSR